MAKSIQQLTGRGVGSNHKSNFGSSLKQTINEDGVKVYAKVELQYKVMETKECEKHGTYNYRFSNGDHFQDRYQEDCPKCLRENATKARLGGKDGIAKRFQRCTFDNYQVTNQQQNLNKKSLQEFAGNFKDHLEMGTPVLLLGGVGTGKTHLASAVANHVASKGYDIVFRSASEIIRSVRDCWGKPGAESRLLDMYKSVDLLIIDEVGIFSSSSFNGEKKTLTDNEHQILFGIINGRYEDMKPIIMISNLKPNELVDAVGQRIASRIQHDGKLLPFDWADYRAA